MENDLSEIIQALKRFVPERDLEHISWNLYCRYSNPLDSNCRSDMMSVPRIRKQVVEFVAEELRKEGEFDLADELTRVAAPQKVGPKDISAPAKLAARLAKSAGLGDKARARLEKELVKKIKVAKKGGLSTKEIREAISLEIPALLKKLKPKTASIEKTGKKRPSRQQWKKIFRKTKTRYRKRLMCCSKPVMERTRRGDPAWMHVCRYKLMAGPRRGKLWITKRIRSMNMQKRPKPPKDPKRGNRRVPFCKQPTITPTSRA